MSRIKYNSPMILTFALIAFGIQMIDAFLVKRFTESFFALGPGPSFSEPLNYFRIFSHVLGHADWNHLFNNLIYILLLGPLLEEKYKSTSLLVMILITALATGVVSAFVFNTGLMGASGVVFMLIILASIVDIKKGTIPLTFVLVAAIFIGSELRNILKADNISQTAHIIGGASGALFGFLLAGE